MLDESAQRSGPGAFIAALQAVGHDVQERWRLRNFDPATFSAIARDGLRALEAPDSSGAWSACPWDEMIRYVVHARDVVQMYNRYNLLLPIKVFRSDRLMIDIAVGTDPWLVIEGHGYAAALRMLGGAALQATYRFHEEERIADDLRLGVLEPAGAECLGPGDTTAMAPGVGGRIHTTMFLDRSMAGVLMRSFTLPEAMPQFGFFPPSLAAAPMRSANAAALDGVVRLMSIVGTLGRSRELAALVDGLARVHLSLRVDLVVKRRALFEATGTLSAVLDGISGEHARLGEAVARHLAVQRRAERQERLAEACDDRDVRVLVAALRMSMSRGESLNRLRAMCDRLAPDEPVADRVARAVRAAAPRLGGAVDSAALDASGWRVTADAWLAGVAPGDAGSFVRARHGIDAPGRIPEVLAMLRAAPALAPLACEDEPGRSGLDRIDCGVRENHPSLEENR